MGQGVSSGTKETINHHNYISGMPNLEVETQEI